ncbi:uncharacterized protein LOC123313382 isoform X2 [Coccinella septempunctata]|uniref:uncharacterized protein LOC123313382 isoform X2 n=1 Tax=Coccinella septempunctata TaxID=41139 RepID=UPI001D093A83|nr:uncharacterized protein LOC123313382 isoform X2 [Coccinella septempunctata]
MSSKIDPREVLSCLNQLGYKNIDATQLQAFTKDLKKLMKYEERKSNEGNIIRVNIVRDLNEKENTDFSEVKKIKVPTSQSSTAVELCITKVNNPVRRPGTDPSQASLVKKKKKRSTSLESSSKSTVTVACPVHFFTGIGCPEAPRSKSVGSACTCPIDAQSQVSSSCIKDNKNKKGKKLICSTLENKNETNTTTSYPNSDNRTYYSSYCPTGKKNQKATISRNYTHDFTHPCYCPGSMKPRSAVIKCNIDCKPPFPKCDPVNLYKYYQRQWKINRIPGEDISREQRFRWCFREKISCGPPARK